jgi:cytochrome c biogenesis protein CcdA
MQPHAAQFIHILWAILAFYAVLILVVLTAILIPTWFICKKAGFSPWLAFITLIPVGHLILLYVLAFADWKVVPAPQAYWPPQPPYPPQPPLPPQG